MYHTSNNYRAAKLCSRENFREPFGLPKHFSWGARASKLVVQINKSVIRVLWIFFSWKMTSLWPPERANKNTRMLSYKSTFSHHTRNLGNAAEYFMFFKWKSRILVCLCIFYSQSSRENATPSSGTSPTASHKEVSPPGPPQNYYFFWIDHLVAMSSFKRRTEVFCFYIIGEMFRTNELLPIRLAFACLFLVRDM